MKAALPWIVIGICVGLLAVNRKRQRRTKRTRKTKTTNLTEITGQTACESGCARAWPSGERIDLAAGISLGVLPSLCVGCALRNML